MGMQALAVPAGTRPAMERGLGTKRGPDSKKAKGSASEVAHLASRKDALLQTSVGGLT